MPEGIFQLARTLETLHECRKSVGLLRENAAVWKRCVQNCPRCFCFSSFCSYIVEHRLRRHALTKTDAHARGRSLSVCLSPPTSLYLSLSLSLCLSLCLCLSLSLSRSLSVSTLCFVWKFSGITFHSLIHACIMYINNACNFISVYQ